MLAPKTSPLKLGIFAFEKTDQASPPTFVSLFTAVVLIPRIVFATSASHVSLQRTGTVRKLLLLFGMVAKLAEMYETISFPKLRSSRHPSPPLFPSITCTVTLGSRSFSLTLISQE